MLALHGPEGATPVLVELARRKGGTLLAAGDDMRENAECRPAWRTGSETPARSPTPTWLWACTTPRWGLRRSRGCCCAAPPAARDAHDTMRLSHALVNLNAQLNQDDAEEAIEVGAEACTAARMTGDPLSPDAF